MAMVRSLTRGGCAVIGVTARPSALTGLRGTPGVVAVVDGRTVPKADFEALLTGAGGTGLTGAGGTGLIEAGGTGLIEAGDAAGSAGTVPPPLAVVIDDAELLADAPIGEAISGFLRTARDRAGAVILAGTTSELGVFRGFIPDARKSRAGLLLCPGAPGDGEVLGVRLPRTAVFLGPPGRGLLIAEADMTLVQVPFDDSDESG
jgi:S-DNA-T family DNA segregation ATPase FtsK/SpoIIIE